MYYIGIDLGTSAVKLLLMEGNGKIVRVTSREYPLYFPRNSWKDAPTVSLRISVFAGKYLLARSKSHTQ